MLAKFRHDSNTIIAFLENNPAINKRLDQSMYDINTLSKLSEFKKISKIIFTAKCILSSKLNSILDQYIYEYQTLIYIDNINIYLLFDKPNDITTMLNKMKKLPVKPNLYQLIKTDFKHKMVITIIDENYVKIVKSLYTENIIIEHPHTFTWEISLTDILYDNYNDVLLAFEDLVKKTDCNGKMFITPVINKGSYQFCRYSISAIYTELLAKVLKNIIQYDEQVSDKKIVINKTQQITDWIAENPPTSDDEKTDYYEKYKNLNENISKQFFTKCIKSLGYTEYKIKNNIYWKKVNDS